jgi:CRISPR-associated protein Csx17
MTPQDDEIDWRLTTWEGSRRAQLRRWLALSIRERLEAMEQMTLIAERLADSRKQSAPTDSRADSSALREP